MIAGAVQLASLATSQGQPYSVNWIAKDNTVVTLDANGVLALGIDLAARTEQLIFRGRQTKDDVEAATTFAELPDIEAPMKD